MTMTSAERDALRAQIEKRRADLAVELRGDEEKLADDRADRAIATSEDAGDRAAADLQAEVDQAELNRDLNELHDYDAALERLEAGTYGECIECGESVGLKRLQAYPAAARCIGCQTDWEKNHSGGHSAAA